MSGGAHWLYLVVAGLFEIGWPLGLKLASNPAMKVWGLLLAVGCMGLSGLFLWLALKGIPMGSAYAVWTGIGAVGAAAVGIAVYGEPATAVRAVCILLIVAGIVGLKLFSGAH